MPVAHHGCIHYASQTCSELKSAGRIPLQTFLCVPSNHVSWEGDPVAQVHGTVGTPKPYLSSHRIWKESSRAGECVGDGRRRDTEKRSLKVQSTLRDPSLHRSDAKQPTEALRPDAESQILPRSQAGPGQHMGRGA